MAAKYATRRAYVQYVADQDGTHWLTLAMLYQTKSMVRRSRESRALPSLLLLSLAGPTKVTDRRPNIKMRMDAKGTSERLEAVRIRLLGGFEVMVGARTIQEGDWRLRKAANLIKLLALASGNRLHREQIMYTLWPNLGISAASNTDHQRFALICGQGRVSTASLNQAPRVRWMASRG